MDEKERRSALLSALTTEHFVLQTAASATVSESAARASIYILALSSSLVATGFVVQSREAFGPFIASVLPAVFLLGLFTVIRLVDVTLEYQHCLRGIAHIRGYYRTLAPEAADYFAAERGRWPEERSTPSLQLGATIGFLTTTATMVAFINTFVAGAGITLLARHLLGIQTPVALLAGVGTALVLVALFFAYQKRRFRQFEPATPAKAAVRPS
jgi:hypothetical protein